MDNDLSFATLVENAQRTPKHGEVHVPDVSNPFSVPLPSDHRIVDTTNDGISDRRVVYDYNHHTEVFCIPGDEAAYDAIQDKFMEGNAIPRYEERCFTKEGEFMVLVTYLTRKENVSKTKEIAKKERAEEIENIIKKR